MNRVRRLSLTIAILGAAIAVLHARPSAEVDEDLVVYRDPDRLLELINDPPQDFYLVDVRTTAEYEAGHIPGALHRDHREIADDLPTEDRDAFVVVYCRTGNRSNTAERTLRQLGFTRVLDWGGIVDWPYSVVTGPEPR